MQILKIILLSLCLYVVAVITRFHGIEQIGIQSDERLWLTRSYKVFDRFHNDLRHVTSHLPHPGLPASVVLAFGHGFQKAWNLRYDCEPSKSCYMWPSEAGRIFIVLTVSFIVPIVFIGFSSLIGASSAFLAALLLALDPKFISFTRMLHIDGMFALVFIVAVILYLRGIIKNNSKMVLSSGIFWGLSILSKPPGVLLIPILFLYRVLRKLFFKIATTKVTLLDWRDIWFVVVAHITAVLLFTRLWDLESHYIKRLGVRSPLARKLLNWGTHLQEYWPFFLILGILIIFMTVFIWSKYKYRAKNVAIAIVNISTIFLIFLSVYLSFPVIIRNLVLYWTWVSGLSGVKHNSYGHILDENLAPGYLQILFSELPDEIFIAFILGVILVSYRLITSKQNEIKLAQIALVLIPLVFIGFLSLSSKQGIRYLLPAFPAIYLLAILTLRNVGALIAKYTGLNTKLVLKFGALLLIVLALERLVYWYPYYPAYFSRLSGGVDAIEQRRGIMMLGDVAAADYLLKEVQVNNAPTYITVAGDPLAFEADVRQLANGLNINSRQLHFGYFRPEFADYLLTYNSHPHLLTAEFAEFTKKNAAQYQVDFKGVNFTKLFKVPYVQLAEAYNFDIEQSHHLTGDIVRRQASMILSASQQEHKPGYIFFHEGIRLAAGSYNLKVSGSANFEEKSSQKFLQLELSGSCKQNKIFALVAGENFTHTLNCILQKPQRLAPKIFWRGDYDLTITSVAVEPVKEQEP